MTGADAHGARLLELLEACGIDTAGVQQDPARATTVKTRVVARNQQVVRIDRERNERASEEQTSAAMRSIEAAMPGVDAVVVADYGKGFLTQATGRFTLPDGAAPRQGAGRRSASVYVAMLAWGDGDQAQSRGGFSRRGTSSLPTLARDPGRTGRCSMPGGGCSRRGRPTT